MQTLNDLLSGLPPLVKAAQLGRAIGLSATTLLNWASEADNDFPRPLRIGGSPLWSRDELIRYFERKAVETKQREIAP